MQRGTALKSVCKALDRIAQSLGCLQLIFCPVCFTAPLSSFKPSFNQSLSVTGAETKPHNKSAPEASALERWLSLPEPCLNLCKVNDDNMAVFSRSCLDFSGKNFCLLIEIVN